MIESDGALIAEEEAGPGGGVGALAKETVVYGFAAFLQRFGGFVLVPVYGHLFTQQQYGVVSILFVTTGLLFALASLQLDSAAQRWFFDTDDPGRRASVIATWVWVQVGVATVLAFGLQALSQRFSDALGDSSSVGVVRLAAFSIPASVFGYAAGNVMRMRRRPWPLVLLSVLSTVVTVGATLWFFAAEWPGPTGVFVGQLVGGVITSVVGLAMLGRAADPRRIDLGRLKEMTRFALPLLPLPFAAWILSSADRYFIGRFVSVGAVGVYQMGSMLAGVVALGTISFAFAWNPWALSIFQRADAAARYSRAFDWFVILGTMLALGVTIVAEPVLRWIADERFIGGADMVPWLAPAHVAAAAVIVGATGALVVKDARPFGGSMYIGALVTLLLNALLVPVIGILGGAIATLVAQSVVVLVVFWRSQRKMQIPFRLGRAATVFCFGAGAGLLSPAIGGLLPRAALVLVVLAAALGLLGRAPMRLSLES